MADERLVITETGFLTEFLNQHSHRTDRPFCFVLGAGVSRASGIPTGSEMAQVWLRELYEQENFGGLSLKEWATPDRLEIKGFKLENVASFYPQLYRRRYGDHEQAGFAFLESQMEGKEPSYGYSVLSYLLSETSHRVVVTTNFDNLVADALSIHSSRFPLVIGHDALAQYAAVELRRPLVAKVHGALGFSPKSQPDEISKLPEGWCAALERILDRYTPIVIGYEGNDGSLMGFLRSLPAHIPDRVLWCVYAPDANAADCLSRVSDDVRKYVGSRRGRFIPIRGFDELMAKLLTKLREKGSVPDLYERLKERARQRERKYDEQQRTLFETALVLKSADKDKKESLTRMNLDRELSEAVSEIAESRKEKPWWIWASEADVHRDLDMKQSTYRRALDALPNSPQLLRNYALFLDQQKGDFVAAREFYLRALNEDPTEPLTLVFYGDFLERQGDAADEAEEYYQRSVEARPESPYALTKYAMFLQTVRKDIDKAQRFYTRALEIAPTYSYVLRNYAQFLREQRGDTAKADELERRFQLIKKVSI